MPPGGSPLPQVNGEVFLADGGLETSLVFLEGVELPCFAAFPLLLDEAGRRTLERYFEPYLRTAQERRLGFILDTPTWRANPDWAAKLGYSREALGEINRQAVAWASAIRKAYGGGKTRILVNGVVGPRGDGYRPDARMTADEAQRYHADQIGAFKGAGADMVSAVTMNYAEEAVGIARAAEAAGVPAVISFTVETDGALASGEPLRSAIERTDWETGGSPAYYMINCAHPTHFEGALPDGESWVRRILGVRANASPKSHAELDEAVELDPGDPADFGGRYRELRRRLTHLSVLGGCCGTDHRHIRAICDECLPGGPGLAHQAPGR